MEAHDVSYLIYVHTHNKKPLWIPLVTSLPSLNAKIDYAFYPLKPLILPPTSEADW